MAIIKYDVDVSPSKPVADFGLSASPKDITLTFSGLESYSLDVKPSAGTIVAGVVAGALVGSFALFGLGTVLGGAAGAGLVFAIAATIKSELKSKINDMVNEYKGDSQSVELNNGKPLGYGFEVQGVQVDVAAETLSLSTYDGMLMATGTVKVS